MVLVSYFEVFVPKNQLQNTALYLFEASLLVIYAETTNPSVPGKVTLLQSKPPLINEKPFAMTSSSSVIGHRNPE